MDETRGGLEKRKIILSPRWSRPEGQDNEEEENTLAPPAIKRVSRRKSFVLWTTEPCCSADKAQHHSQRSAHQAAQKIEPCHHPRCETAVAQQMSSQWSTKAAVEPEHDKPQPLLTLWPNPQHSQHDPYHHNSRACPRVAQQHPAHDVLLFVFSVLSSCLLETSGRLKELQGAEQRMDSSI
ncbi:hypothetical protein D9C73_015447 [Collichthys lucidus]|uniref:Uncharacterized protein n=1 Tax=Collichthys lucidus TaxID=240159 RepID=A0A4V6AQQ2_COLLU|nr:hypothetical protein D9C73_015447 [Collichthys lucidus]